MTSVHTEIIEFEANAMRLLFTADATKLSEIEMSNVKLNFCSHAEIGSRNRNSFRRFLFIYSFICRTASD